MNRFLYTLLCVLVTWTVNGQSYYDAALSLGIFFQYEDDDSYGAGVSSFDFDGDGDDDITLCQYQQEIEFYQYEDGEFSQLPGITGAEDAKSCQWVDFDNDGDSDLFFTRTWGECALFERVNDWGFIDITASSGIDMPVFQTYGSCWGDYNNDQLLDLYICNYHFDGTENFLFENLGDGTFEDVTEQANAGGGSQYSFQSTFLDYDRDGWQDLFIINDRYTSPNVLLRNNMGVFEDATASDMGMFLINSMSNTIGDFDNDADLDVFISNDPTGHLLHVNQGDGTFIEMADEAGLSTNDFCWAAQWMDFDLDGWQDIHICCSPFWDEAGQNKFFRSEQDGTFTFDLSPGFDNDESWSHSSAVGDFNNDGMFDIFVVNDAPDLSSLWMSTGSENNFLKVSLEGTQSNRDGIGSWIEIWCDNAYQMRYTYCGESYLSQNSGIEIFGLGQNTQVDSMLISWPSGLVDLFYDVPSNQHLNIIEGSSLQFSIQQESPVQICSSDSLILTSPEYSSYLWSTGDTTQSVLVETTGSYFLTATNYIGSTLTSDTIDVTVIIGPEIESTIVHLLCYGDSLGSIDLINNSGSGLTTCTWSNGGIGTSLENLPSGEYIYEWTDSLGCLVSEAIYLEQPPEIHLMGSLNHVTCNGFDNGSLELAPQGGVGMLSVDWGNIEDSQMLGPGNYEISVTDANLCTVTQIFTITEPEELIVDLNITEITDGNDGAAEIVVSGGIPDYVAYWSNGANGFVVSNLAEGDYSVWVMDSNDCFSYSAFSLTSTSILTNGSVDVTCYPNPFKNTLYIAGPTIGDSISIYDYFGRLMYQSICPQSGTFILDLSDIAPGSYVCRIQGAQKVFSEVLIKSD